MKNSLLRSLEEDVMAIEGSTTLNKEVLTIINQCNDHAQEIVFAGSGVYLNSPQHPKILGLFLRSASAIEAVLQMPNTLEPKQLDRVRHVHLSMQGRSELKERQMSRAARFRHVQNVLLEHAQDVFEREQREEGEEWKEEQE